MLKKPKKLKSLKTKKGKTKKNVTKQNWKIKLKIFHYLEAMEIKTSRFLTLTSAAF